MPPRPNRRPFAPGLTGALHVRRVRRNPAREREGGGRKDGESVVHYIALELPGIRLPDETARLQIAIKEMGDAYQFQKFAWIVETELNNTQISEKLVRCCARPTNCW